MLAALRRCCRTVDTKAEKEAAQSVDQKLDELHGNPTTTIYCGEGNDGQLKDLKKVKGSAPTPNDLVPDTVEAVSATARANYDPVSLGDATARASKPGPGPAFYKQTAALRPRLLQAGPYDSSRAKRFLDLAQASYRDLQPMMDEVGRSSTFLQPSRCTTCV